MRKDVTFKSGGLILSAWLYVPDSLPSGKRAPAITMAHGLMAVKEQYLDSVARKFEPTPLLMIATRTDDLTPVDLQIEAFSRAREPKKLHIIPAGHFSVYAEPWQSRTTELAVDWFGQWL